MPIPPEGLSCGSCANAFVQRARHLPPVIAQLAHASGQSGEDVTHALRRRHQLVERASNTDVADAQPAVPKAPRPGPPRSLRDRQLRFRAKAIVSTATGRP